MDWPPSVKYITAAEVRALGLKCDCFKGSEGGPECSRAPPPAASSKSRRRRSTRPALGTKSDIRLLHLRNDPFDFPIRASFSVVSLDASPAYTALSYTWANASGNSDLSETVSILSSLEEHSASEAAFLDVTENCEAALRRLRGAGRFTVWVDAVCIDQANATERAHQVGLMSRVYANATRVFIYVGEDHMVSGQSGEQLLRMVPDMVRTGTRFDEMVERFPENATAQINPFFQRPYFKRKWVIQEIALAKEARVACGALEAPWGLFSPRALSTLFAPLAVQVPPWLNSLERLGPRSPQELVELVFESRYSQCSDKRDRIFSLLGLLAPEIREELWPAYTKTVEEILAGFAAWIIQRCGLHLLLKYRQTLANSPTTADSLLPSWVPLWDEATEKYLGADKLKATFSMNLGLSEDYIIVGSPNLWQVETKSSGTEPQPETESNVVVHAASKALIIRRCKLISGRSLLITAKMKDLMPYADSKSQQNKSPVQKDDSDLSLFAVSRATDPDSTISENALKQWKKDHVHEEDYFASLPGFDLLLHLRRRTDTSYDLLNSGVLLIRPALILAWMFRARMLQLPSIGPSVNNRISHTWNNGGRSPSPILALTQRTSAFLPLLYAWHQLFSHYRHITPDCGIEMLLGLFPEMVVDRAGRFAFPKEPMSPLTDGGRILTQLLRLRSAGHYQRGLLGVLKRCLVDPNGPQKISLWLKAWHNQRLWISIRRTVAYWTEAFGSALDQRENELLITLRDLNDEEEHFRGSLDRNKARMFSREHALSRIFSSWYDTITEQTKLLDPRAEGLVKHFNSGWIARSDTVPQGLTLEHGSHGTVEVSPASVNAVAATVRDDFRETRRASRHKASATSTGNQTSNTPAFKKLEAVFAKTRAITESLLLAHGLTDAMAEHVDELQVIFSDLGEASDTGPPLFEEGPIIIR